MILDKENLFSDDQNLTSTGASTNYIDLGVARDIGKGVPIPIVIQLTADAGGTTPTLDIDLEVDDNTSFSSATTVVSAKQIAGGSAGDKATIVYVPEGTNERYVRLNYTLGGTSPDYTITAGIVHGLNQPH